MAITILSYLLISSRMVGNRFLLLWAEPYLFLPTLETTDFAEKQAARIKPSYAFMARSGDVLSAAEASYLAQVLSDPWSKGGGDEHEPDGVVVR
jgi:hypothetical protein